VDRGRANISGGMGRETIEREENTTLYHISGRYQVIPLHGSGFVFVGRCTIVIIA